MRVGIVFARTTATIPKIAGKRLEGAGHKGLVKNISAKVLCLGVHYILLVKRIKNAMGLPDAQYAGCGEGRLT
jgi:hypothetical protein